MENVQRESKYALEHWLLLVAKEAVQKAVKNQEIEPSTVKELLQEALSTLEGIVEYSDCEKSVYINEVIENLLRAAVMIRKNENRYNEL